MKMKISSLVGLILFGMTIPAAACQNSTKPPRPNVILIMADDLGWGDTSYYGHPVLRTPCLDQMAADGVRFDRFYAAAPVCSPTRGSVITGRHPYRYGITFANRGKMEAPELTLAEVLKDHGYRTGHFGKWHLGTLTSELKESNRGGKSPEHYSPPWENGFEVCFSTEAKTPTWWNLGDYEKFGTHYWTGPDEMVKPERIVGDDSKIIVDAALPFIADAVEQSQPFFSVIWFHTPHKPIVAGPKYLEMYQEAIPETERGKKENAAHYYGCITAMDEQIGRLRDRLNELGVSENTMIWFCSDNGPELNTAGRALADLDGIDGQPPIQLRGRKRSLYEGGIRVPGILVWPGSVPSGLATDVPCVTSDYLPTILNVVQIDFPADTRPIDGVDLMPIVTGKQKRREVPIGFQSGKQAAFMDQTHKIVRNDKSDWQLFDLSNDPGERNPIQDEEIQAALVKQFELWRASCIGSAEGGDYRKK